MRNLYLILFFIISISSYAQQVITDFNDGTGTTKFLLTSIDNEPYAVGIDLTGKLFVYRFVDEAEPLLFIEKDLNQNLISQNFIVKDRTVYINRHNKIWTYDILSDELVEYKINTCEVNDIVLDDKSTKDQLFYFGFNDCSTVNSTLFKLENQIVLEVSNEIKELIYIEKNILLGSKPIDGANNSKLILMDLALPSTIELNHIVDDRLEPLKIEEEVFFVDDQRRLVKWVLDRNIVEPLVEDIRLSDQCRFEMSNGNMKVIGLDIEGDYVDIYTMDLDQNESHFFSVTAIQDSFIYGNEILLDSVWYFITRSGALLAYTIDEVKVDIVQPSEKLYQFIGSRGKSIIMQSEAQLLVYDIELGTYTSKGALPIARDHRLDYLELEDMVLLFMSSDRSRFISYTTQINLNNDNARIAYELEGINTGGLLDFNYEAVEGGFTLSYRDTAYYIEGTNVYNISRPYAFSDFRRTYQVGEDFYGLNIKKSGEIDIYHGNKDKDVEYKMTTTAFLNITESLVGLDHLMFRGLENQAYVYSKDLNGLYFINIPSIGALDFATFEDKRVIHAIPYRLHFFDEEWNLVSTLNMNGVYKLKEVDNELYALGVKISQLVEDSLVVANNISFNLSVFDKPKTTIVTDDYFLRDVFNSYKVYQPKICDTLKYTLRLRPGERKVLGSENMIAFRDFTLGIQSYHLVNITADSIFRKDFTFAKEGRFGTLYAMRAVGDYVYLVVHYTKLGRMEIIRYDKYFNNPKEVFGVSESETFNRGGHAINQDERMLIPFGEKIYTLNFETNEVNINPNARLSNDDSMICEDEEYLYYVGISTNRGRQLMRIEKSTIATLIPDDEDNDKSKIQVYPNPCSNRLYTTGYIGGKFEILTTDGRLALVGSLNTNSIDISSISKGQYILLISSNGQVVRSNFVKI